jgi:hypothetical protein
MSDQPPQPISSCPACNCRDLFIRKRFPQKLGLAIIIAAAIAFLILAARPHTFYIGLGILIAVSILDLLLFPFFGNTTVCYRCRKDFPRTPLNPDHGPFDLATAEKYRTRA